MFPVEPSGRTNQRNGANSHGSVAPKRREERGREKMQRSICVRHPHFVARNHFGALKIDWHGISGSFLFIHTQPQWSASWLRITPFKKDVETTDKRCICPCPASSFLAKPPMSASCKFLRQQPLNCQNFGSSPPTDCTVVIITAATAANGRRLRIRDCV